MAKGSRIPLSGNFDTALQQDANLNIMDWLKALIGACRQAVLDTLRPVENDIVTPAGLLTVRATMLRALADHAPLAMSVGVGMRIGPLKQMMLAEAEQIERWANELQAGHAVAAEAFRVAGVRLTDRMSHLMVDKTLTFRALWLEQPSAFIANLR
jgi:hypothetical protein